MRPPGKAQIFSSALFWEEAPAVSAMKGGGCQEIRRPAQEFPTRAGPSPLPTVSAAPLEGTRSTTPSPGLPRTLPVGCQPRRDVAARNLGDDVAPKEGTVDHPHGLWVPVEFGFLWE